MTPNIQTVHTQTPTVVEIEPANFQTFVQSHTGKSTGIKSESKNPEFSKSTTFTLTMHKDSRSIAKKKPKIRIVHIPTPEVIEIEPAYFQIFVQSLTGKSMETKTELRKPELSGKEEPIILCDESSNSETEILNGFRSSFECKERRITDEEELTRWGNLGDESLIGIEDLDKFINELIDFPLYD